jgi:ubiquinone/menaquinone biosynthesis C-methylase UbiE
MKTALRTEQSETITTRIYPEKFQSLVLMPDRSRSWEQDYVKRGRLWRGAVHQVPDLLAGARVLELGCGSGATLSSFLNRPWDVVAIDFSKRAGELSRQIMSKHLNADVITADARWLPFSPGSFHAVFAFHTIGHMLIHDRKKMVRESLRVVKDGGRVFFRGFSSDDFRAGTGKEVEERTFQRAAGILHHYFLKEEVISLFSPLTVETIENRHWKMRVNGRDLLRAEIVAVFSKTGNIIF